MPPGADFGTSLVQGLETLLRDKPPVEWAQTQIYVNTSRMRRRIREVFDQGPARLLPQVRLVTDLAHDPINGTPDNAISPLRRRLELAQFVSALLEKETELAPRAALYDLSDSLAKLMDEMHGEGVDPSALSGIDVGAHSGHWQRSLTFLNIIAPFFDTANGLTDPQARQRHVVEKLIANWQITPPQHPIIVAGSTGSRGATGLFMKAVATLPQGAVILPGFDFDMPDHAWGAMNSDTPPEDHPQFRFHRLMSDLGVSRGDIEPWFDAASPAPERNKVISLSLRPAPVTDEWLSEGPALGDLRAATSNMTLVEAEAPRQEAEVIALRLRQAAQDGTTAALITPDRMLTRQVAAALDLWGITPDDSAGMPLPLSAPGRFLRHVADMRGTQLRAEDLLVLLKHPLCHSDHEKRGDHLRHTRDLELHIRRKGPPFPTAQTLLTWDEKQKNPNPDRTLWVNWVAQCIDALATASTAPLAAQVTHHREVAEALAAGPNTSGSGALWLEKAGREASRICDGLTKVADAGGTMSATDYRALFGGVLAEGVVRDRDAGHPNILIWGTLEARVQGADLVILGGMNDGVWPEAPPPDPWLNRSMRQQVGLLLPERRVGLSAHDYQQAIAAKEVWITRAKRSADSETIPSRWVNRLINLMSGLPMCDGPDALAEMTNRGDDWLRRAATLSVPETEIPRAKRPSPRPPVDARPKEFSVTKIKTLVRDPYAIYAEKVLRLKPLDPLTAEADAPLRGTIFHAILEDYIKQDIDPTDPNALPQLLDVARKHLARDCPWPTVRAQWQMAMERIAPKFLADEIERRTLGGNPRTECKGKTIVVGPDVTLTCTADRIDTTPQDEALIYDYKTGAVPTVPQQKNFDKQLLLTTAMVDMGAFEKLARMPVASATFIGLGSSPKNVAAPLKDTSPTQIWAEFTELLTKWQDPTRGYSARMAHFLKDQASPYDHLSRHGEWTISDDVHPEDVS